EERHGVDEERHGVDEGRHDVDEERHGVAEGRHGVDEERHVVDEERHGVAEERPGLDESGAALRNASGFRRREALHGRPVREPEGRYSDCRGWRRDNNREARQARLAFPVTLWLWQQTKPKHSAHSTAVPTFLCSPMPGMPSARASSRRKDFQPLRRRARASPTPWATLTAAPYRRAR